MTRTRLTPRGAAVAQLVALLVLLALLGVAYAAGHSHGQADAVRTLTDPITAGGPA